MTQEDALIAYLSSFHPLTEEDGKAIVPFFYPGCIMEGDFLFEGNKVCKELFFIVSGVVRIISTNHKGDEVTYFFIGAARYVPYWTVCVLRQCCVFVKRYT